MTVSGPAGQDIPVRGTLQAENGRGVVRIELSAPSPVSDVWAAATEPDRLAKWAGDVDGERRIGGASHAVLIPSGWDGTGGSSSASPVGGSSWRARSAASRPRPTSSR